MLLLTPQRSTCHEHKAVNQGRKDKNHLDVTGIGATACAHHGCFVPHSVVDFQKGERYNSKILIILESSLLTQKSLQTDEHGLFTLGGYEI
jgi:hypothetical protein